MPTLQEVLVDPNYVNANPATKRAIFEKFAGQDPNYAQANDATKNAIRQKFGVAGAVEEKTAEPTAPKPIPERTYGEAFYGDFHHPNPEFVPYTTQLMQQLP